MKRIIIICEGQTEQRFCNEILYAYFIDKGIVIENQIIKKTGGGIVNWYALKFQIEKTLKQDPTAIVSTLIDFYGIHQNHDYPNFAEAMSKRDKVEAVMLIENGMYENVQQDIQNRFLPYIQLHELECMLFADRCEAIRKYFESADVNIDALMEVVEEFPNPELINNSRITAPSKRLEKNIRRYKKVLHGIDILKQIGFEGIRSKCIRFNEWIIKLGIV